MARISKIPERLHEEMMTKTANGESNSKIQVWLKSIHKIDAGLSSVNRAINAIKKDRQATAQVAYANAVANSANQDIKIIDNMVIKLEQEFLKAAAEGDRQGMKHMADSLHKFLQTRMDLSGINHPDAIQSEDQTLQLLLDRIGDFNDKTTN